MITTPVLLTDDEMELVLIALDYYRRHGMTGYDPEDRAHAVRIMDAAVRKLHDA